MALDPRLLEILACPLCKVEVKLTADKKGLRCVQCRRTYPVKNDIPIMLVEEAILEPSKKPRKKTRKPGKPRTKTKR